MKPLLAIVTCNDPKYRARAEAQMLTWVPTAHQFDVKSFVGTPATVAAVKRSEGHADLLDEVVLPVGDRYEDLPRKVQVVCQWALERGYTRMVKLDDDVYVIPEYLAACMTQHDYIGRVRPGYPVPYCSGYAYVLSRRAMEIIAAAPLTADTSEDRFVGNVLAQAGIVTVSDNFNFQKVFPPLAPAQVWKSPLSVIGHAAVFAEMEPSVMREFHRLFNLHGKAYEQRVRKPRFDLVVHA